MTIKLEDLPLGDLSLWLQDNMLPDARTFLLPGTVAAASTGSGGLITPNYVEAGSGSSVGLSNTHAYAPLGSSNSVTASGEDQVWLATASLNISANSANWTPLAALIQCVINGVGVNGPEVNTYHNTGAAGASSLAPYALFDVPAKSSVSIDVYARVPSGSFGGVANLLGATAFRIA